MTTLALLAGLLGGEIFEVAYPPSDRAGEPQLEVTYTLCSEPSKEVPNP